MVKNVNATGKIGYKMSALIGRFSSHIINLAENSELNFISSNKSVHEAIS